jgi:hypothetical protein
VLFGERTARFVSTLAAGQIISGVDNGTLRAGIFFASLFMPSFISDLSDPRPIFEKVCPMRPLSLKILEHPARIIHAQGAELNTSFISAF